MCATFQLRVYVPSVIGHVRVCVNLNYDYKYLELPGISNSNRNRSEGKIEAMNRTRNACVTDFINSKYSYEYVAMQDQDCNCIDPYYLTYAVNYLKFNPQFGAIALPWKKRHFDFDHIRCLCVVFRSVVFKNITFRATTKQCSCIGLKEDIESMGYLYSYLPSNKSMVLEEK